MSKRASGCDMVLHKDAPDRMVINACVLESEGCIDTEKLFLNCCCEKGSQNSNAIIHFGWIAQA